MVRVNDWHCVGQLSWMHWAKSSYDVVLVMDSVWQPVCPSTTHCRSARQPLSTEHAVSAKQQLVTTHGAHGDVSIVSAIPQLPPSSVTVVPASLPPCVVLASLVVIEPPPVTGFEQAASGSATQSPIAGGR